jgi:acyl-CoA thioester hydrolase
VSETVFKHLHRVVYAECTVGNHVYYARYLDMLEGARGECFRQAGIPLRELQAGGLAFPVVGVQIEYKGPARYDDLLTIELWLNEMKGARLNCGFRILNAAGNLLAEGETRHVCANLEEKPQRLPREVMEKLQPFVRGQNDAG